MKLVGSILFWILCVAVAFADNVSVGPARSMTRIYLSVGDTFTVTLPASSAKGFAWKLDTIDRKVLQPLGKPVVSGGAVAFNYKAIGLGRYYHQMSLRRPSDKKPAQIFSIMVRVVVAESHKTIVATLQDNNAQKKLAYGDTLEVRLPAPAQGYMWGLTTPTCLMPLGKPVVKDGLQVFRFRVAHAAVDFLTLFYRKPGVVPLKAYRISVNIPRAWSGASPLE